MKKIKNKLKIGIIISQFNREVVDGLLKSAEKALQKNALLKGTDIVRVPGAFEIPYAAARMAASKKYDGLIALGCVIKGETDHYEAICRGVSYGVQKVSIESGVPIMFGVLMCKNEKLARARLNKGGECVNGLIELLQK